MGYYGGNVRMTPQKRDIDPDSKIKGRPGKELLPDIGGIVIIHSSEHTPVKIFVGIIRVDFIFQYRNIIRKSSFQLIKIRT